MTRGKKLSIKDAALRYISYRARSESEVEKKLSGSQFEDEEIREIIEWLKEFGFLDDLKFARDLAESRVRNKRWGRRKIAFDLRKYGVPGDIANAVLSERDENDELQTAEEALRSWTRKRAIKPPLEEKETVRAVKHLESRGFSTSQSIQTVKRFGTDDDLI